MNYLLSKNGTNFKKTSDPMEAYIETDSQNLRRSSRQCRTVKYDDYLEYWSTALDNE